MKVSIITINYNNADGLKKTIQSVISQSYKLVEYIIIDGGSSDMSRNMIEESSEYITNWVSEEDNGVYHAMNKGIGKASGKYLLFLNSGDIFFDEKVLEKAVENFKDEQDIIFGNVLLVNGAREQEVRYPGKLTFSFLYKGVICHQAMFIKRSVFETVGLYDEHNKLCADWFHFVNAIVKYHCTYLHLPLFISKYDETGMSSQSSNALRIQQEKEHYFEKEHPLFYSDYKDYESLKVNRKLMLVRKLDETLFTRKVSTAFVLLLSWLTRNKKEKNTHLSI